MSDDRYMHSRQEHSDGHTALLAGSPAAHAPLSRFTWLATAGWLVLCVAGLAALWRYERTPGNIGEVPNHWPATSEIERDPQGTTLVMFAHPQCPCTRASIGELSRLVASWQGKIKPYVVFIRNGEADLAESPSWREAREIPSVTVLEDAYGEEAQRFNMRTSGETVVYDANGVLKFHGGITRARGHHGDNAGSDAIHRIMTKADNMRRQAPVFGCPLASTEL